MDCACLQTFFERSSSPEPIRGLKLRVPRPQLPEDHFYTPGTRNPRTPFLTATTCWMHDEQQGPTTHGIFACIMYNTVFVFIMY